MPKRKTKKIKRELDRLTDELQELCHEVEELRDLARAVEELRRWTVHETSMRKHFQLLDALDSEAPDIAAHVRAQSLSIDGAKKQLEERRQKSRKTDGQTS